MTFEELEQEPFYFWDTGDQLKRHIYERSRALFAKGDALRDEIRTVAALQQRQAELREFFISSLGCLPDSATPLHAVTTGIIEEHDLKIEKVIFQSRPQHYVTGNLYLPDGLSRPRAAVLFLCGHFRSAKHADEYQIACRILARAGLVVLAVDPIGQGERFSYYEPVLGEPAIAPGCPDHNYAGEQCRMIGWSIARFFLHDAMRSVDYLLSRPEVDASKIGVTGNSGGGTQTSLMMLSDPRIAAAAPATFIMNREIYQQVGQAQDAEQIWPGFTAAGFDHEDILLAMAPRPVCVLAVKSDFFPIEATRRTVQRCRRLWEICGQSEALQFHEEADIHRYSPAMAREAANFFSRHFYGKEALPLDATPPPLPEKELWCTVSGQVRADFDDAQFVHDSIAQELSREHNNEPTIQKDVVKWLRQKVFSHREECEPNPRFYRTNHVGNLRIEMAFWWSQPDLINLGYLFRPIEMEKQALPVTIALFENGTRSLQQHANWIRSTCADGQAVLVVNLSGHGLLEPNAINSYPLHDFYGTFHKLVDDLDWLDDSLAALRVFDILRVLTMIRQWSGLVPGSPEIFATGRMSIYAQLAALLEPQLHLAKAAEPPESFANLASQRYYYEHDIKSYIIPGIALREP